MRRHATHTVQAPQRYWKAPGNALGPRREDVSAWLEGGLQSVHVGLTVTVFTITNKVGKHRGIQNTRNSLQFHKLSPSVPAIGYRVPVAKRQHGNSQHVHTHCRGCTPPAVFEEGSHEVGFLVARVQGRGRCTFAGTAIQKHGAVRCAHMLSVNRLAACKTRHAMLPAYP